MHRGIYVKKLSGTTAPRISKFDTNIGYDHSYGVWKNWYPLFLPFFFFSNKIFCQAFLKRATSSRILKFRINIWFDLLYCVRGNQHPRVYHILYLSFLRYKFFVTDFSAPERASIFKFCVHLQRIGVYCVKENHSAKISFAFFFPSLTPV